IRPRDLWFRNTGGGCPRGGGGAAAEPPRASHQYFWFAINRKVVMRNILCGGRVGGAGGPGRYLWDEGDRVI
ncbi:MAG: hypothetical protein LUO86_06255, partial [Methanomicrobiales archaeon]|nr:hypothetical protein [Methanomicrobiales archaeon]